MNPYLSSSGLKALARGQLIGHYGTVAAAYFLHTICIIPLTFATASLFAANTLINWIASTIATFLISLITGLFVAGETYMYLKIACNQPVVIGDLFFGFRYESQKVLTLQAVIAGLSLLTSLPSSVIGFLSTLNPENSSLSSIYYVISAIGLIINLIISLMLSQVFFLMLDFPEYTPKLLLSKSMQLMKKNKWRLFKVQISFLPLVLLGYLSCGVGMLWVQPYMMATEANFYLDLIKKKPNA